MKLRKSPSICHYIQHACDYWNKWTVLTSERSNWLWINIGSVILNYKWLTGFAECKNCQLDLLIINSHVVSEQMNPSQRKNFNFDEFTIGPIFRSIKSLNRPHGLAYHPPYSHPAKTIRCKSDVNFKLLLVLYNLTEED